MAATTKRTGEGTVIKFIKPKYIVGTLYTGTETGGTENPAGDTFIFEEIKRDTSKITQEDATTSKIECETSDTPIYTATTEGEYKFEAECDNIDADILAAFCGYTKVGTKAYAPDGYSERYARFAIVMEKADKSLVAAVMPKVLLNSKAAFESLNTQLGSIKLSGTGNTVKVTNGSDTINSPFYIDTNYTLPA